MTKEDKFLAALKDIFVGAKIDGESGYINLMRVKARYFKRGVFPRLKEDIEAALTPFPDFREELFDKLYTFFHRYFSESGSIYFRYTPLHQNVYERVYTDDRDVMLFWKTHMLYYVKTDRLFQNMDVEVDGVRFHFDVSTLQHKQANEKRSLVFAFTERRADGVLAFSVTYSERGRITKLDDIRRALHKAGADVDDDTLQRAFRLFERQSEVDFFINKNARAFLREQFDLWMYQYIFAGESQWTETRIRQLQALKDIAYKIIDFIAQFEDELVRIWNKPKFVLDSHYVITLDRIAERDAALLERILAHPNMAQQAQEWRDLGMVNDGFELAALWQTDLMGRRLHERYRFLPLDTKHVPDLEPDILGLFDHLDQALDGWLIKSENYQALNTMLPKLREWVKCVYIDPPYNASDTEIAYINRYKHASWLCLMEGRLAPLPTLLCGDGIACVTIDDYEVAGLRFLLDHILLPECHLGTIVIRNNPSGRATVRGFAVNHEYAMFYSSSPLTGRIGRLPHTQEQRARYGQVDELGRPFEWENFRKSSRGSDRKDRPKQFYPLYYCQSTETLRVPTMQWQEGTLGWSVLEEPRSDEASIYPVNEFGIEKVWSYGVQRASRECARMVVRTNGSRYEVYKEKHLRGEGSLPRTWWDSASYSARDNGTRILKDMFGPMGVFDFAKSVHATMDCLRVADMGDGDLCLDFFAGSGTTAHAVMNLNGEDGGQRKYILVEMADYFDTVILPRIKKVAFSDKWKDGKAQEGGKGMGHFVKYYRLEQYEDVLRRARYQDADLFDNPYEDPYNSYVFLRDTKLLDNAQTGERVVEIDQANDKVRVDVSKLYPGIDLAETLSCLTGKWIRRITKDSVEFEDGERVDLADPEWKLVKPLIWW